MGKNLAASGGEVDIKQFEITSNYNKKTTDISGGVMELFVWESLFDSTVRASVIYADTGYDDSGSRQISNTEGGGNSDFVNSAGEKTELVIEDLYKNKLVFTGDYHLRVSKNKREAFGGPHTTKTLVATEFYSKECIDNEDSEKRVVKKYQYKTSDNVKLILTDVLGTPKNITVDKSKNDYNFLGGREKVFQQCTWLSRVSVPDGVSAPNGVLAGYLFYETAYDGTKGGYNFKSIDLLFSKSPVRKYIMTATNEIPPGYSGNILNHFEHVSIDLQRSLVAGDQTKRKLETINPYNVEFAQNDFSAKSQNLDWNNGGKDFWKLAEDLNLKDKITRINTKAYDTGIVPTGLNWKEQKKESKEINYDIGDIIRQATNRFNQLFTYQITIIIPCDLGLHVGDVILVDFPEISQKEVREISKNKSGIYMIMDLAHRITRTGSYTSLHLTRDSIFR
jgi:hypothetical protein